jgi:hypothetical protein
MTIREDDFLKRNVSGPFTISAVLQENRSNSPSHFS